MNCPECNVVLPDNAISCPYCNSRFGVSSLQDDTDAKLLSYLVPSRATLLSIIAGYTGLFSVLVVPAPFALLFGILALRDIKKRQARGEKMGGKGRAIFAIVIGGLFTLAIVSLVAFLSITHVTHR
jgi:hypothetical protein